MIERPIVLDTETARSIAAGFASLLIRTADVRVPYAIDEMGSGNLWPFDTTWAEGDEGSELMSCPYGECGDRLWVREAFHQCPHCHRCPHCQGDYVAYKATHELAPKCAAHGWNSPVRMPRQLSRLTLIIRRVCFQKLQEISDEQAMGAGIVCDDSCGWFVSDAARDDYAKTGGSLGGPRHNAPSHAFRAGWNKTNAKRHRGWHVNPWVWVVSFDVETGAICDEGNNHEKPRFSLMEKFA